MDGVGLLSMETLSLLPRSRWKVFEESDLEEERNFHENIESVMCVCL